MGGSWETRREGRGFQAPLWGWPRCPHRPFVKVVMDQKTHITRLLAYGKGPMKEQRAYHRLKRVDGMAQNHSKSTSFVLRFWAIEGHLEQGLIRTKPANQQASSRSSHAVVHTPCTKKQHHLAGLWDSLDASK